MPFQPDPFLRRFERLRRLRLRLRPVIGYAVAIIGVAGAAGIRFGFADILDAAPFITFYPVILLATVAGGVRAGALATCLSATGANFLFLQPVLAFSTGAADLVATTLFVLVSMAMVFLVGLLNQAIDHIADEVARTRLILDAEPAGVIGVDDRGIIRLVNAAVERQLGYGRDKILGQPVDLLVPEAFRAAHGGHRADFMRGPTPRMMGAGRDLNAVAKDGSLVPVEIGLNPVEREGATGALATIVDISERKKLEWRAQVLANEVRHRANNMLALIQALARRTLPREHVREFTSVLDALARAHAIYAATSAAPLRAILAGELAAFPDQVTITGGETLLTPRAGQDFALIVHELATNALKYGALSTPDGKIAISCGDEAEGTFVFTWTEKGGPTVRAPTREGFGHTILRDVAGGFATSAALDFRPDGLHYELRAPLDRITRVAELKPAGAA